MPQIGQRKEESRGGGVKNTIQPMQAPFLQIRLGLHTRQESQQTKMAIILGDKSFVEHCFTIIYTGLIQKQLFHVICTL